MRGPVPPTARRRATPPGGRRDARLVRAHLLRSAPEVIQALAEGGATGVAARDLRGGRRLEGGVVLARRPRAQARGRRSSEAYFRSCPRDASGRAAGGGGDDRRRPGHGRVAGLPFGVPGQGGGVGAVGGGALGPSRLKRQLPRTRLLKLSEKGSSNARSPDSAAIRGTKRAEKCLLGGPQGATL